MVIMGGQKGRVEDELSMVWKFGIGAINSVVER
jgi:hypothetical protein